MDADRIVAGAPGDDGNGYNRGAIHVFARDPVTDVWSYAAELHDPNGQDWDSLGSSVAVDGPWIVAGAPYDSGAGTYHGAVHTFRRTSGVWSHYQQLPSTTAAAGSELVAETVYPVILRELTSGPPGTGAKAIVTVGPEDKE